METFDSVEQELYEAWFSYFSGGCDITDVEVAAMNFVLAYPNEEESSVKARGLRIKKLARERAAAH